MSARGPKGGWTKYWKRTMGEPDDGKCPVMMEALDNILLAEKKLDRAAKLLRTAQPGPECGVAYGKLSLAVGTHDRSPLIKSWHKLAAQLGRLE